VCKAEKVPKADEGRAAGHVGIRRR